MVNDYRDSINNQYAAKGLDTRIVKAIKAAGVNTHTITREDMNWFDQLHAGGNNSTRILANIAGIEQNMKVLDVGCGIGGASRTLSAEFGCCVVGIDITSEYIKTAQVLTEMLQEEMEVTFQQGDALNLPFDNQSFNTVWTQSVIMNIEDKYAFLHEAFRVLRKGGILAIEGVVSGVEAEIRYPVLWADSPSVSFLVTPDMLRKMVGDVGFIEAEWQDITSQRLEWQQQIRSATSDKPHPLRKVSDLVQSRLSEKIKNTALGFKDGAYRSIRCVLRRPE